MNTRRLSYAAPAVVLLIALLAVVTADVRATGPTSVSGVINANTTWTLANSPYIATGSIKVNPGVRLTIEPGVQVKFAGLYRIQVEGELRAIGTPAQHIVFTSNKAAPAAGDWTGVTFTETSVDATFQDGAYVAGSTLQYAEVLYGGTVLAYESTPYIGRSRFAYNQGVSDVYPPRYSWGDATVVFYNAPGARFDHNLIEHNAVAAIKLDYDSTGVQIEHNLVLDNDGMIDGNSYAGTPGAANVIRNNVFAENRGESMLSSYLFAARLAEISGNSFVRNASAQVTLLINNDPTGDSIHHNTFVSHQGDSVVRLLNVMSGTQFTANNLVANATTYDVDVPDPSTLETLPPPIDLTQNYWGSTNLAIIKQRINHVETEFGEPFVSVEPFRTSPVLDAPVIPPTGLSVNASGSSASLVWNANAESDIKGYRVHYDVDGGYPYAYAKDVGKVTSTTLTNLPTGVTHFAVTAYDTGADGVDDFTDGHESWLSDEDPPLQPPGPPGVHTPTPEPTSMATETPTSTPTLDQGATPAATPTATLIPLPTATVAPEATATATPKPYSFTINNGSIYTNDVNVTLALTAPPNGLQMMISNDGGFAGATWEPFAPTKEWQITQYGSAILPRTVYVRFSGPAGLLVTAQDDIILDVTPPTGSVQVLSAAAEASTMESVAAMPAATAAAKVMLPLVVAPLAPNTQRVHLKLTATDDASGVGYMLVSSNTDFAGAQWHAWNAAQPTIDWTAPLHATSAVYVRFADNAGNISPTIIGRITLP